MKKIILLALILFFLNSCSSGNTNLDTVQKVNIIDKIGDQGLNKALVLYENKDERILAAKQEIEQKKIEEENRILAEKKEKEESEAEVKIQAELATQAEAERKKALADEQAKIAAEAAQAELLRQAEMAKMQAEAAARARVRTRQVK